jgi:hypothetical protein
MRVPDPARHFSCGLSHRFGMASFEWRSGQQGLDSVWSYSFSLQCCNGPRTVVADELVQPLPAASGRREERDTLIPEGRWASDSGVRPRRP